MTAQAVATLRQATGIQRDNSLKIHNKFIGNSAFFS